MDIEKLAPVMGQAGDLANSGALTGAVGVELVEARIAVAEKVPGRALEMALWADALPIRGLSIEDGGRCITGMGALVADIDPEPARRGLAEPGASTGTGVSSAWRAPSQDVPADRFGQGRQHRRSRSNPIGQGQAVEFDAFSGVDLSLAVKRQVVAVLGHQHIGKKSRAWPSAPNRQGDHRKRCPGATFAGAV